VRPRSHGARFSPRRWSAPSNEFGSGASHPFKRLLLYWQQRTCVAPVGLAVPSATVSVTIEHAPAVTVYVAPIFATEAESEKAVQPEPMVYAVAPVVQSVVSAPVKLTVPAQLPPMGAGAQVHGPQPLVSLIALGQYESVGPVGYAAGHAVGGISPSGTTAAMHGPVPKGYAGMATQRSPALGQAYWSSPLAGWHIRTPLDQVGRGSVGTTLGTQVPPSGIGGLTRMVPCSLLHPETGAQAPTATSEAQGLEQTRSV